VVELSEELRLREPEDEYWDAYWSSLQRRLERKGGFFLLAIGLAALALIGLVEALRSPKLLTLPGLAAAVACLGFLLVFISVARQSYHESKNDPYRKVKR